MRIVDGTRTIGYLVEDGHYLFPEPTLHLYTKDRMADLTKEGYKYYNHDGDIRDSEGNPIVELPTIAYQEVDREMYELMLLEARDGALTDAEASKYYSFERTENNIVSFLESSNEITTRDELIAYLTKQESQLQTLGFVTDVRPLNSFVSKEALFTLEELREETDDNQARYFISIVNRRHTFGNYNIYKNLIAYLKKRGALTTDTPTEDEFLKAYYAWGPEGINATCINTKFIPNADWSIRQESLNYTGTQAEGYIVTNRETHLPIIVDDNGMMRHCRFTNTLRDKLTLYDFKRDRLALITEEDLIYLKNADLNGYKYFTSNKGALSNVHSQLIYDLMSDDNFIYYYKVNSDRTMLKPHYNNSGIFFEPTNFRFVTTIGHIELGFDYIKSEADFILWNLAVVTVAKNIQARSVKSPISNSWDMCRSIGMSPFTTVQYLASVVKQSSKLGYGDTLAYYVNPTAPEQTLSEYGIYLLADDIPEPILSAFNLTSNDIESIQDFIDKADIENLIERRQAMVNGTLTAGMLGYDETFVANKEARVQQALYSNTVTDAISYYYNVKFILDCMQGMVTAGNMALGESIDGTSAYKFSATLMMSILYAQKGDNPSIEDGVQLFSNFESGHYIDYQINYKMRDNLYRGYQLDFLKTIKAISDYKHVMYWSIINRVYTEPSALGEEARPYLVELIAVKNCGNDLVVREITRDIIIEALADWKPESTGVIFPHAEDPADRTMTYENMKIYLYDYLAAQLLFKSLYAKEEDSTINIVIPGLNINIPIEMSAANIKALKSCILGDNIDSHRKFITLYDLSRLECIPTGNNCQFNFLLVNADITPWSVTAKGGFSIRNIPILPSYFDKASVNNAAQDASFYDKEVALKNISGFSLQQEVRTYDKFIPDDVTVKTIVQRDMRDVEMNSTLDDLDCYLQPDTVEPIYVHIRRWVLANKLHPDNMDLLSIPLKQDKIWGVFTPYLNMPEVTLDNTYGVRHRPTPNPWLDSFSFKNSGQQRLVTSDVNRVKLAKVAASDFDLGVVSRLYNEKIVKDDYVFVRGSVIMMPDGHMIQLSNLDSSDEIALSKIVVQYNGSNYVVTPTDIYKLEV